MSKLTSFELRQKILSEEFDYTLLKSVLSSYSSVTRKINELLKAKIIQRIKKGLYTFGPKYQINPICLETLANLIYGPSCISLEYALSYHGLIPERVDTITSVTPKRDKKFKTPLGIFSYRYLKADKYPIGINQVWLNDKHPVLMASAEKALCDYLLLKKIPPLDSDQEVSDFLEEDLRINQEKWNTLSSPILRKINKSYKNENIIKIADYLEREVTKA